MDCIGAVLRQLTEAASASFGLNYCFCGNQGFDYAYYHLKTHACDFLI